MRGPWFLIFVNRIAVVALKMITVIKPIQSSKACHLDKITIFVKFDVIIPVTNFWFWLEMRRPWISVSKQKSAVVLQFNGNDR